MITKIRSIRRRYREAAPTPALIAFSCAAYFLGAVGIGLLDRGFLLLAWLMTGFLAIAIYLTLDAKGSLINAYTVSLGGIVALNVAGYFFV